MNRQIVLRTIGAALLLIAFLSWGSSNTPLTTVLIWALFAVGSYLVTQASFAIFFTVFTLSGIHLILGRTELFGNPQPTLFTLIFIVSGSLCLVVFTQRFRQRIRDTREARWKDRQR